MHNHAFSTHDLSSFCQLNSLGLVATGQRFLDEDISHLDINNESIVNDNIKGLHITRIIVAHRPETIASADVVMDLSSLSNAAG